MLTDDQWRRVEQYKRSHSDHKILIEKSSKVVDDKTYCSIVGDYGEAKNLLDNIGYVPETFNDEEDEEDEECGTYYFSNIITGSYPS